MAKLRVYDPILKQQVIDAIKYSGLSVSQASKQYGVHHKSIYFWLSKKREQLQLQTPLQDKPETNLTVC